MDVNSNNEEFIHTGVWTDWSHGRSHGATLTLLAQDAGFLTAFLALFVTIAANHLWRIISFIIHQLHSSQKPKDALHHQQQVTFKNTTSPATLIWEFILLAYAWRHNTRRSILRNAFFVLLALTWLAIAASTTILSAKITKPAGNHCLIMSPNCGLWTAAGDLNTTDPDQLDRFDTTQLHETNTATAYARSCYAKEADRLAQCNIYSKTSLPFRTTANASCPFKRGMCLEGDSAAFLMDTGILDSREHLGMNVPDDDRLFFRKAVGCAPLTRAPYITVHNDSHPLPNYPFENYTAAAYHYGSAYDGNGIQNYTHYYDTVVTRAPVGYMIHANLAYAGDSPESQIWVPRDELNRTDADISIFFLNSNVMYEFPTDDPMFSAHVSALGELAKLDGNTSIAEFDNWYMADAPTTILGCTDQFQICNGRSGICSELQGIQSFTKADKMIEFVQKYHLTAVQTDTFVLLTNFLALNNMYYSIYGRTTYALRAQETLSNLNQVAALPNNQWQIEVQSWFETNLAKLQERSVEFATGPRQSREGRKRLDQTDQSPLCKAQKVRCPAGNISFSVLGISCIIGIGSVIIISNLCLDTVMAWIGRKWFPRSGYRRLNWALDDKLQLQRMAFQGLQAGHWYGNTSAVPVTEKGDLFCAPCDVNEEPVDVRRPNSPNISETRSTITREQGA
ncbi:hypothetical protein BDV59DRAFT_193051 [Aspergillus ambiguus]|uniref:uncharacterized protein n=1 Tax=Aspergillus ambiguus TaxID=176160 RepID=UPI003CCE0863